jgi:hypothetical protein
MEIIAGRRYTPEQLRSIKVSIERGDVDTITYAAAGGIALAIQIIKKYEQEAQRRSS